MFKANASEVRALGSRLRKSKPEVYKELRRAVLAEARIVAEDARGLASWSSKIPGSIKASAQGINTAVVRAGGKSAPDAAPFEHAGASGSFRHPVFGRKDEPWVEQPAKPFLHPAAMDRLDATVSALEDAVITAVDHAIDGV